MTTTTLTPEELAARAAAYAERTAAAAEFLSALAADGPVAGGVTIVAQGPGVEVEYDRRAFRWTWRATGEGGSITATISDALPAAALGYLAAVAAEDAG